MDSKTAKKEPRAFMLELPTELLQQIARDCSDETLLQLRLTCKNIEAAVLDQFTKAFFSQLECFILDSARLVRVDNILSDPNTSAHLRLITFTPSADDNHAAFHVVPKQGQNSVQAAREVHGDYEAEQYDLHVCQKDGLSDKARQLMDSIIKKIAQSKNCGAEVDMGGKFDARLSARHPQLLQEILGAIHRQACPLSSLIFNDLHPLKSCHFEAGGALQRLTENLKAFYYEPKPINEADLQTSKAQEHWRIVSEVIEHSTSLEELVLRKLGGAIDVFWGPVLLEICTSIFARPNLSMLRCLTLSALNVPATTLHRILKACAETLENFAIGLLGLVGHGDVYSELFRYLREMPKLDRLLFYQLCRRKPGYLPGQGDNIDKIEFLVHRDGRLVREADMPERKPLEAKSFLKLNTESPLVYTQC